MHRELCSRAKEALMTRMQELINSRVVIMFGERKWYFPTRELGRDKLNDLSKSFWKSRG